MDITIYKEFIDLINKHCHWAVVDDYLYKINTENQYDINTMRHPKSLLVRFRNGSHITDNKNALPIQEWALEKALLFLETDINFRHRMKMHACTPDDADQWLQIAVFGNIMFK
ncbi:MAG: hypothetical protein LUH50_11460 [Bacteroides intestinalis]|nr:hypothetical protein [Bacteroides intestinalis]